MGSRHAALDRLADGGVKLGGAVALQQPQQGGGDGSQIGTALGGTQEQGLALRYRLCEVVGTAVAACGVLVLDQGLDVAGVLDLRPLVVAAAMTSEHLRAIDDAHLVRIGQHREQALHLGVRDGIIVEVEAHIRGLAGLTATRSMSG